MNHNVYYPFINIARAIAMLMVIIGHVSKDPVVTKTIYSFHMPLFFILSGMLYKKSDNWNCIYRIRFKSLIIPYFEFYILTLVYYWIIEIHFRPSELPSEWLRLIPLVLGSDFHGYMSHNVVLWFLPALFSLEIIFNFIMRIRSQRIRLLIIFTISILGFMLAHYSFWYLPWGISQAIVMLIFYYSGFKSNQLFKKINGWSKTNFILIFICLFVLIGCFPWTLRNDVASGSFPNLILFLLDAYAGSILIISLAKLIRFNKILETFGKGDVTIVVLAFQGVIYRPLLVIANKLQLGGGEQI